MSTFPRIMAVTVTIALLGVSWSVPVSAATTTKDFANKQFSFSYPNTLVKSKASCGSSGCYVELSPNKKKSAELDKKGAMYQVRVSRLGTKADPLTPEEENALEAKDWSGFLAAVKDEINDTFTVSKYTAKSYKKSGFTANLISFTFTLSGATAVVNTVIMTKNKKTAYMVQELWAYTNDTMSKNPFSKNLTSLVKTFKLLK